MWHVTCSPRTRTMSQAIHFNFHQKILSMAWEQQTVEFAFFHYFGYWLFKAPGRTAWSPLSYHFPAVTNCNRSLWFGAASKIGYSIDGLPLPFVERIRDIGVYHDCRLKYDKHICLIVHNAYKRAVLMLNVFIHERDILKLAFIIYVRPLLEFSCTSQTTCGDKAFVRRLRLGLDRITRVVQKIITPPPIGSAEYCD